MLCLNGDDNCILCKSDKAQSKLIELNDSRSNSFSVLADWIQANLLNQPLA
jgi:hypothetical protein